MLKFQSFSYLMQTANLLEKILMLGKIEGRRQGADAHVGNKAVQFAINSVQSPKLRQETLSGLIKTMIDGVSETVRHSK